MNKVILIIIWLPVLTLAQIDTSEWYPLKVGNYWEYIDSGGYVHESISVIGDTVMPNGKTFFKLSIKDLDYGYINNSYRRVENGVFVYTWLGSSEFKYYDFSQLTNHKWIVNSSGYYRSMVLADSMFCNPFNQKLEFMEFEDQYWMDSIQIYFEREWQQVCKGVGEVTRGRWGGYTSIIGAIINGKQYGNVTSVKEGKLAPVIFKLFQNYPNPFNPTTIIKYSITKAGFVKLNVMNVLGELVASLVNEYQPSGNYNVVFTKDNLSSGVYIYQLHFNDNIISHKMLLIK